MKNTTQLENDLWEAADQLRANSKPTATEDSEPVLGLIFLRHVTNRYLAIKAEIEKHCLLVATVPIPSSPPIFNRKHLSFCPMKRSTII